MPAKGSGNVSHFVCKTCGKPYIVPDKVLRSRAKAGQGTSSYCSFDCLRNRDSKLVFICERCGCAFKRYPSDVKKSAQRGSRMRFCSKQCDLAAKAETNRIAICETCGMEFAVWKSQDAHSVEQGWSERRFCSRECYEKTRDGSAVEKYCLVCGVRLERRADEFSGNYLKRTTCSSQCRGRLISRTKLSGGPRQSPYHPRWRAIAKYVRQRDRYTCLECGAREDGRAHDVHHIDYNKANNRLDNLMTLCVPCHRRTIHVKSRPYWIEYYQRLMRMLE